MTIRKLIKELQKVEKRIGPRKLVMVDLSETRLISDEYTHWAVLKLDDETIPFAIDDNFELADGSQRMRTVAVIGL